MSFALNSHWIYQQLTRKAHPMASTIWVFGHCPTNQDPAMAAGAVEQSSGDWSEAATALRHLIEQYCLDDDEEAQGAPDYDPAAATMLDCWRSEQADGAFQEEDSGQWLNIESHDGTYVTFYLHEVIS
jgi:phytoene dehydrogenase-like protein